MVLLLCLPLVKTLWRLARSHCEARCAAEEATPETHQRWHWFALVKTRKKQQQLKVQQVQPFVICKIHWDWLVSCRVVINLKPHCTYAMCARRAKNMRNVSSRLFRGTFRCKKQRQTTLSKRHNLKNVAQVAKESIRDGSTIDTYIDKLNT